MRILPMCCRFNAILCLILLGGCVAYAPSTTDWRKTPKIVLQVCALTQQANTAKIILYRSGYFSPIGFDFPHLSRGKTNAGQVVFESLLEGPGPSHDAIGVQIEMNDGNFQDLFVFAIPQKYSADWSEWVTPIASESTPIRAIDRFKYLRGKKQLDHNVLATAPRLRYRLEYVADFERTSRTTVRYEEIPDCLH